MLLVLLSLPALAIAAASYAQQLSTVMNKGSSLSGSGTYTIQSVASGESIAFVRSGVTNFIPVSSKGATVSIEVKNGLSRICGANNKCASAQWSTTAATAGGGADWAAVSYAKSENLGQKQWWSFIASSSSKNQFYIIATDHASDQPARAFTNKAISTPGGYRSVALADWNKATKGQLFTVTKN